MENKNELEIVVKESGLETTQAVNILKKFNTFFEQAKEWEEKARGLVVKDENDTEIMIQAREARLVLKKIRTDAEKVRKDMKEEYIRTGKAIDGVANVIKALIVPIEEHLERQEKFIENIKIEKALKTKEERVAKLSKYLDKDLDGSATTALTMYNLDDMSDAIFDSLLGQVKLSWDKKQDEIKKEEDKRIENEKRHVLWEKRQFELQPYKFFFDSTDKKLTIDSTEEEFITLLAILVKTKKDFDKDQEDIAKENDKLKKEKEEKDKKDEEDRKKREAEQKKKDDEHKAELKKLEDEKKRLEAIAEKKEEEERMKREAEELEEDKRIEKERQASIAPEKDKLTAYAEAIRTIKSPDGLSKAGLEVVKTVEAKLLAISQEIKLKIKEL